MQNEIAALIIRFFTDYCEHFDELKAFMSKKLERVVSDDLVWLTDSLQEEQRMVMRGTSLENKRILVFNELGFNDYKSYQLLDEMPEDFRGRLRLLLDTMAKSINFIKETNDVILDIIERKLDIQAELMNRSIVAGTDTYTAKGQKIHKNLSALDDSFLGKV